MYEYELAYLENILYILIYRWQFIWFRKIRHFLRKIRPFLTQQGAQLVISWTITMLSFWLDFQHVQSNLYKWSRMQQQHNWSLLNPRVNIDTRYRTAMGSEPSSHEFSSPPEACGIGGACAKPSPGHGFETSDNSNHFRLLLLVAFRKKSWHGPNTSTILFWILCCSDGSIPVYMVYWFKIWYRFLNI